jgi:hypothetical protein
VETQPFHDSQDVEDFQFDAPGDEVVSFTMVVHADAADAEFAEFGKEDTTQGGNMRQLPLAKVEAGKGGDAEESGGEGHLVQPLVVDQDELLDALGGEEL